MADGSAHALTLLHHGDEDLVREWQAGQSTPGMARGLRAGTPQVGTQHTQWEEGSGKGGKGK